MLDTDIAISAAADGGIQPAGPTPQAPGFLGATRKYAVGNGTIRLNATDASPLPAIPASATSCLLVLEAAPSADSANPLGRFWSDGSWPNEVEGLPIYAGSIIEIIGQPDLQRTRIFSTDGRNHKINVQYFSI